MALQRIRIHVGSRHPSFLKEIELKLSVNTEHRTPIINIYCTHEPVQHGGALHGASRRMGHSARSTGQLDHREWASVVEWWRVVYEEP